jgi:hypothetical protein
MGSQVVLLFIGFALTTVAGGSLTYLFQTRAWNHQYERQRDDAEHEQASRACDEISTLLDKRLYRMKLLWNAARAGTSGVDDALHAYREVLVVWNDNLNRLLAVAETYFGPLVRKRLEFDLYEDYAAIGRAIEYVVRTTGRNEQPVMDVRAPRRRLQALSNRVYDLDRVMLLLLQERTVGRRAPRAEPVIDAIPLQFGSSGLAVRRLQDALVHSGIAPLTVDGQWGVDTEIAVREFQRHSGISVDGVVGNATLSALQKSAPDAPK